MTAPVETDIEIIQSATFRMRVAWSDTAQDPAVPISLAGYRAHMQIRSKQKTTATVLVDISSLDADPVTITIEPSSATGVLRIRIPATVTATLLKNCFYDLFVVKIADPSDATRLTYGAVSISKSVTQDI